MSKTPGRITASNVKTVAGEASTKQKMREDLGSPYKCDYCGKTFKNQSGLSSHMNTHNVQRPDTPDPEAPPQPENPTQWVAQYARKGKIKNPQLIEEFSKQKKVAFIINQDPNSGDKTYLCGINGQDFEYPVEEYIELPEGIVRLIKSQYKATEQAKKTNLISRADHVQKALTK